MCTCVYIYINIYIYIYVYTLNVYIYIYICADHICGEYKCDEYTFVNCYVARTYGTAYGSSSLPLILVHNKLSPQLKLLCPFAKQKTKIRDFQISDKFRFLIFKNILIRIGLMSWIRIEFAHLNTL